MSQGKTVSRLLNEVIESVVDHNPVVGAAAEGGMSERISVRLRPGDRSLLNARATQRGMKPGSYVATLLRGHLRSYAPLPTDELNHLKVAVGQLGAVGRAIHSLSSHPAHATSTTDAQLAKELRALRQQVTEVRASVAALVRTNLESWES